MTAEEPKQRRNWAGFRSFLDISTLIASIATVVTLLFIVHDRRDQANIAAWTLLQTYLQQEHRAPFNVGQTFAFETLAQHGVLLNNLDAHDAVVDRANLHHLVALGASFKHATLANIDISDAILVGAHFEYASIVNADFSGARLGEADFEHVRMEDCNCRDADFAGANLTSAWLVFGDFRNADFTTADISDLHFFPVDQRLDPLDPRWFGDFQGGFSSTDVSDLISDPDPDMFKDSCYRSGHRPQVLRPSGMPFKPPNNPQGMLCVELWGKKWEALETP